MKSAISSGLLLVTAVVVAADLRSPEGTVDFYLEAQKQNKVEEMAQVRDFEAQARETLRSNGGASIEPSEESVRTAAKDLEKSFRMASRVTLPVRSCYTGAAHYESDAIARVPVFCERENG
jgi:hypothetical protein